MEFQIAFLALFAIPAALAGYGMLKLTWRAPWLPSCLIIAFMPFKGWATAKGYVQPASLTDPIQIREGAGLGNG